MDTTQLTPLHAATLHHLDTAVMIVSSTSDNEDLRIVYVNPAWERLTGYTEDDVLGHNPQFLSKSDFLSDLIRDTKAANQDERHIRTEILAQHTNGTTFRVAVSGTMIPNEEAQGNTEEPSETTQKGPYFVIQLRDMSQQEAVMTQLRRLETLTHLQREVATTELDLDGRRQKVAEVAMEVTGADSAVVEEAEADEMVYYAVAGDASAQKGLRLPMQNSISGLAYAERTSQLVRNVDNDERIALKEQAHKVGFRSGVLSPLVYEDRTYGVLKVLAHEPDRFNEEQRFLLELASGVLAASLYNAVAYHDELERRGRILDALPAYISYIDQAHRYQEVNTVYESNFGIDAENIRGQYIQDILGEEGYGRIRPYLEAALRGERVRYEMNIPFPSGEERTLAGDYVPDRDWSGNVEGVYAIVRDVTDNRLAHSDYLTGLLNRRDFEEQGRRLLAMAQRYDTALNLVMLDIDRFKQINDTHGHLAGDAALKELAELLGNVVRESDIISRWGGDEFVILLPHTERESAEQLAIRLSRAVREQHFSRVDQITISCGGVAFNKDDDLHSLVGRADEALYQAKEQGGNCVQVVA